MQNETLCNVYDFVVHFCYFDDVRFLCRILVFVVPTQKKAEGCRPKKGGSLWL